MPLKFDFDTAIKHAQQHMPEGCSMSIEIDQQQAILHVWGPDGAPLNGILDATVSSLLQSIAVAKTAREEFDKAHPKKKVKK